MSVTHGVESICSILFFFFQAEDGIRDIGVTGVQTCALPISFPVCYDRLVRAGVIGIDRLIDLMSCGPARIFNLPGGTLRTGAPGDVTLLNQIGRASCRGRV